MSTNAITITGNITADPEPRALPSGTPVATFTVADTPRRQDPNTGDWKDSETLFQRVTAWNDLAANAAKSLHRGDTVTVTGRLVSKSYTAESGDTRTYTEIRADDVAVSLRYATAAVTKTARKTA
jgi:single-strand DNA-binding protein